MNVRQQAEEYLTTRDYKMKVVHDVDDFRTLEFKHEDGHFTITTWPKHLCISGDMGTFVFRLPRDMLTFFSGEFVNLGYWSEKVQAQSVFGDGIKSFSVEDFRHKMLAIKNLALEDGCNSEEVSFAFSRLNGVYDEADAVEFSRRFKLDGVDVTGINWPEEYTFHYAFACHAINFACNDYFKHKVKSK